ncbi:hypothetical protein BDZ97DRAFT_766639 [Flammula alnicola]|nr:hypothetical protein BDZ97DRAFT_766639 [Flammula alnicola]
MAGPDSLLQLQLIGALVSAIAYGLVVSLFFHSLALLVTSKKYTYSNRIRMFLITYIVVMFLLSTAALVQGMVYITIAVFSGVDISSHHLTKMNEPLTLPFTIWGADGFMLWRCFILYTNTTRVAHTILYGVLFLISLASIGSGILYYLIPELSTFTLVSPLTPTLITISITIFVNFTLTALVCGRLIHHQEGMRRVLGAQYSSPFMRIIVMCVESCVLIVVTCIVYVALFARGDKTTLNGCIIPLLLLPHICVLSPTLIVYHVAKGRAITTAVRPSHVATPNFRDEDIPTLMRSNDPTSTLASLSTGSELHV